MTGLLPVIEQIGEPGPGPSQPRLDGAFRDPELGGDLGRPQVGQVVQHHHLPLPGVDLGQRRHDGDVLRTDVDRRLGAGHARLVLADDRGVAPAAAKMLRWLLWYEPSPDMIQTVAGVYTKTNGDIKAMVRASLESGD